MSRPKTIFCDLDGTLVRHCEDVSFLCNPDFGLLILPGVREMLRKIDINGYHLVITTGRKESMREATIKQLQTAGIMYDQLIMGIGGGERILINDRKKNSSSNTAFVINLERNGGMQDVEI